MVFDASHPDTMKMLDGWLRELNQHNAGRQCSLTFRESCLVTLFLACNKMDKNNAIDKQAVEAYGREIHARVFFTSAKTGEQVDSLFTEMAASIVGRKRSSIPAVANYSSMSANPIIPGSEAPAEEKKKCCCSLVCNKQSISIWTPLTQSTPRLKQMNRRFPQ